MQMFMLRINSQILYFQVRHILISKDRALKFAKNQEVIALANGILFKPVEGNEEKTESVFI